MRLSLVCHPDTPCLELEGIEVQIVRPSGGKLDLTFFALGQIDAIHWPAETAPARADRLWETSCFEAFVGAGEGVGYAEFNFSPSRQWAAYRFSGYRAGMQDVIGLNPPEIRQRTSPKAKVMQVHLDLSTMPGLPPSRDWRLGLSAVIKTRGGKASYWALVHPPGKPDFHHNDCFALKLPASVVV